LRLTNFSSRWGCWLLIGITTLWLLWATLRADRIIPPNDINLMPMAEHGGALACLINNDCLFQRRAFWFLLIDVVGNIIIFVPLGFGLAGVLYQANLLKTIGLAALGGFSLSLMIELIQLAIPSRSTDVDDLIFNTLGTFLGALCFALVLRTESRITGRKVTSDS
jgi:hypothetical protein